MESLDDQILLRLREVLDQDPRSDRGVCVEAGIGPNYIRGIFEEGKKPSIAYLMRVLKVLGNGATIYVLTGLQLQDQDFEFLNLISNLSDKSKEHAAALFRELQEREGQ